MDAIAGKLTDLKPVDPLTNLRTLDEAARHGWLLSMSQLAPLLGLKTLIGQAIHRYGFICMEQAEMGLSLPGE